jgi:protein phosphatase 2C
MEELNEVQKAYPKEKVDFDLRKEWERVFVDCFKKVDEETEQIAPETVGSTAVVAVVSASHIIIANCGDSRAVLSRGKQAIPLSVDHKVRFILYNYNFFLL